MNLYLLSYDLCNEKDYQKLYTELSYYKAISVLESVWCLKRSNTNAEELRDHFRKFIDNNDRLFVAEITDSNRFDQWASYRALGNPNNL